MNLVQFTEVLLIALFAGAYGSMLGLGGGIILVPALIALLNVEPRVAVAASIVSVIATSSAGAVSFLRRGFANIELAVLLETTTTAGALAGTFLAMLVSGETVAGLFALLLIYAAYAVVRPPAAIESNTERGGEICGTYIDHSTQKAVSYSVTGERFGMTAGFLAGNISGLLGVGGGLVMVPVMISRMGVPLRAAAATSNFMIGVTAVATAIPHYAFGHVQPALAAPCAIGVLLGAPIGSWLATRTRTRYLRAAFAVVLVYTAFAMARRAGLLP